MKDYGRVRSTVSPKPMVIDELSVWIHKDIVEVNENVGEENEFVGFEYDMIQYEKDEYIKIMAKQNESLESQLTDTQLALVEIYEGVLI